MHLYNFIIWSANPEIFPSLDWIEIRWYGFLFAMGFIIGQQIMYRIYKAEGKPQKDVDTLTLYMIIATILGARLGHVFFYEPKRYLSDPISILKTWEGGLASHGAAVGILLGIWLYSNYLIDINPFKGRFIWKRQKREGQSFLYVMDRMVILVALTGALIRFGNFMNAEIIGLPTENRSGVVFARDIIDRLEMIPQIERVQVAKSVNGETGTAGRVPVDIVVDFDPGTASTAQAAQVLESQVKSILASYSYITLHVDQPFERDLRYDLGNRRGGGIYAEIHTLAIPRHPAQLYESISSALLFLLLLWLWIRKKERLPEGQLFGIFLVLLFTLRFLYEFVKENQVAFEEQMALNMGQLLSVPFIVMGIVLLLRARKNTT
jgi:phosphatidylglycerol---prolipoprotein diacylglyceryl transferase